MELAPSSAPSGSTSASTEPSTRRGSVRLDRRRIIGCQGEAAPGEARKTDKTRPGYDGNATNRACRRHNSPAKVTRLPLTQSRAMIGMAGENSCGAIKLFQQHDADELMWPSRQTKGKNVLGASA